MIQKLHLGTTLAALILFFLPWIDLQCSHQSLATQTGIQTITGGHTPVEQKPAAMKVELKRDVSAAEDEGLGHSVLVAAALVAVAAALGVSVLALFSAPVRRGRMAGGLCALALALLGTQMMIGFPAKKSLESHESQRRGARTPMDEMESVMAGAIAENFEIRYLPALYVELVLLAIPTLILANDWIDRVRVREGDADSGARSGGEA